MQQMIQEQLSTPIVDAVDVIVAGAGPAGISAALSAADAGSKVLLLECAGCLGGVWTAGLLSWVFDISDAGIGRELTDRLLELKACEFANGENMRNFSYDAESMKFLLDEMCKERGVKIQLNTRVVGAQRGENGEIQAVMTESKSFRQAWLAKSFIDCTGDGDLGAIAGNGFTYRGKNGECQPATLIALVAVPNLETVTPYISFFGGKYNHHEPMTSISKLLKELNLSTSYGHPTLFHLGGNILALMINHQYGIDATNAASITRATLEARAEINRITRTLAIANTPFKGLQLVSVAESIGIREGRLLEGKTKIVRDDLLNGKRYDDPVCTVRFNMDVHSSDPSKNKGLEVTKVPPYDIPKESLMARDIPNLFMAGRCISGDRDAFSSFRITGAAVSMGQSAGLMAAELAFSKGQN